MSEYYVIRNDAPSDELYHYGVKGMRWGHRKAQPQSNTSAIRGKYDSAKADYKQAKKDYNKAYNKAYNYSSRHPIGQFVNKKKAAEADRRWDAAFDKANSAEKARLNYKQAKTERKQAINTAYRDMQKKTSIGDKLVYNDATRRKAAKYMVDNNMTMAEANEKAKSDARRNTIAYVGAFAAITVASLYRNR